MALTAVTSEAVGGHSILGLQNSFFNSQIFLVVLLKYLKIVHLYGLRGRSRPFSEKGGSDTFDRSILIQRVIVTS